MEKSPEREVVGDPRDEDARSSGSAGLSVNRGSHPAFWAVPHQCADGSIVQGTLLVKPTRDFESPDTEDPDPTTRVQFLAVCPDGTSFSWAAPVGRAHSELQSP